MTSRVAENGTFAEGLTAEAEFYSPLGALLSEYDVLLCPTLGVQGMAADLSNPSALLEVNGEQVSWIESVPTVPFNVVGRVPVFAVPSGLAPNGLPTGVQIGGRTYNDSLVFTLGLALEAELDLWTQPSWWPRMVEVNV